MRKITLLIHVSLDGFVAGTKGEMNWIKMDEELFDFVGRIVDQADAALYGRITYEMMESYWPLIADKPNPSKHDKDHSAWYAKVAKFVLSNSLDEKKLKNTKIIGSHQIADIKKIKEGPGGNILMLGSPSVSYTLLKEGLIDSYWIFLNPVLLGKGIPLFKDIPELIHLKFTESKILTCGVVALQYERA